MCILPFQPHALLARITASTTEEEQQFLSKVASLSIKPHLLPIKTVGVQVNKPKHQGQVDQLVKVSGPVMVIKGSAIDPAPGA